MTIDIKNLTSLYSYFYSCENIPDITNLNVSHIDNMANMFLYSNSFNQDISNWDVSNVENMTGMFYKASSFNQDLSTWNVEHIKEKPEGFDDNTPVWQEEFKPRWGQPPRVVK